MPLRASWPQEQIKAMFDEAIAMTVARRRFTLLSDAQRFRFACYNFRRKTHLGAEFSFVLSEETTECGACVFDVTVAKIPKPLDETESEKGTLINAKA